MTTLDNMLDQKLSSAISIHTSSTEIKLRAMEQSVAQLQAENQTTNNAIKISLDSGSPLRVEREFLKAYDD